MFTPPSYTSIYQHFRKSIFSFVVYVLAFAAIAFPLAVVNKHLQGSFLPIEACANTALILCPFFLLPNRAKWLTVFPVWIVPIFLLVNIWHMRFFGDFMPPQSFVLVQNIDSTLINSTIAQIHLADATFFVVPIIFTVYVIIYRKHIGCTPRTQWSLRLIFTAISIVFYFLVMNNIPASKLNLKDRIEDAAYNGSTHYFPKYVGCGFPAYTYVCAVRFCKLIYRDRTISNAEQKNIDTYYKLLNNLSISADSVTPANKNLIFIVVESLESNIIGVKCNGVEVTPTLNQLIQLPGTLFAPKMVSQIRSGSSSDGQFMYNTGLYPSSETTTASFYGGNEYFSLPKILDNYYSLESICEEPAMWNHTETNRSFGYDNFYYGSNKEAEAKNISQDAAMFERSAKILSQMSETPYFAFLVTLSMHVPYKDPNVSIPEFIKKTALPESEKGYYAMTNAFDSALGAFLQSLHRSGQYDNSLIVIASDHHLSTRPSETETHFIPFIALNAGVTRRVEHPVGQVDVLPTVCQLMGVEDKIRGRAMGISMLNPELTGAIAPDGTIVGDSVSPRLQKLLRMSTPVANTLLRTDYFSKN